jgi:SAM-dependent methyltransferase
VQARLIQWLCCPRCRGGLTLETLQEQSTAWGTDILRGSMHCACGATFPIEDGIPWFTGSDQKQTRQRFAFEWLRYPGNDPGDRDIFLTETQLAPGVWHGKRVLDAGCGMGRYSAVAHGLGAEVVAFDLSEALLRLLPTARQSPTLHLVQGDILHPPFRTETFDIVYSLGVVHHTPEAETAVTRLHELVKPGGRLSVWVYGTAGRWRQFKTNPLRSGREWLVHVLPLVWGVVWVRERLSNAVRRLTVRMPHRLLYRLCYPLAWLGGIPVVRHLTFSLHSRWRVRLQENFDWLAPPYQSHHAKEQVRGWFERLGYKDLAQLPHGTVPKVGICGKKA